MTAPAEPGPAGPSAGDRPDRAAPPGDVDGGGGRRTVRLLAAARLASTGGSQAAQLALAYTVYERTSSAVWVSASLVASAGVVGLFGPLSGRLSDRLDRRRVMVAAELGGAAGWLLVALARSPLMLVLAALVATAANAPFRAAASASVPNLVRSDQLTWANSTMATATNTSMVVGPLVGGALIGVVGPRSVFVFNAVTFAASALVISRLRGRFSERRPGRPGTDGDDRGHGDGRGDGAGSWRRLAADPRRRLLLAVTALGYLAFGITLVADLPLIDHFGGGSLAYALLTTLWGVGAIAGSATAGRLPPRLEGACLTGGALAMGLSLGSLFVVPNLPLAIALGTIGGFGDGLAFTPWYTLMQRLTPDHERGAAFAMAETIDQGAFVGGMVAAGPVIHAVGVQPTYLVPGVLMLAAAGAAHRLRREPPDATSERPP